MHFLSTRGKHRVNFRCRISKRAKYLRIVVTRHGEVEIVVPEGVSEYEVTRFVQHHQDWIQEQRRQCLPAKPVIHQKPTQVVLPAIDETWQIQYQATEKRAESIYTTQSISGYVVEFSGAYHHWPTLYGAITQWLKALAKVRLKPKIRALSRKFGLPFHRLTIRHQKTRWGSCSSKGNINLNCKLLFLPPELVRYVITHELCHTVHLNHSRAFWALVEQHEPNYRFLDNAMNKTHTLFPSWFTDRP